MPSPFLQFIEFPTLSEAQVSTLETVSELFLDARQRPISHIMNISYEKAHLSTILISSEEKMKANLFEGGQTGDYDKLVSLMDQMVGLSGGNENLQKVFRGIFTINGWNVPRDTAEGYRIVEVDGCIGFEIDHLAFLILRTARPVDLDLLRNLDYTHPRLFEFLNPLVVSDKLTELH